MNKEDVKKLKVVELREALKARGIETKGNKPVLVKRLERAIAKDAGEDVADESMSDSINESINESHEESATEGNEDEANACESPKTAENEIPVTQEAVSTDAVEPKAEPAPQDEVKMETPEEEDPEPESSVEPKQKEEIKEEATQEEETKVEAPAQEEPSVTNDTASQVKEHTENKVPPMEEAEAPQTTEAEMKAVDEDIKGEAAKEEAVKEAAADSSLDEAVQITADVSAEMEEEMEGQEEAQKKPAEEKMETKEGKEETVGPNGEVLQVVDSVGEVDVIPIVDKNEKEESFRKRRRSRSRSRSPHRRHRSRHSRSRSPRRRSRSGDRKRRSSSKERRDRETSRDRGRERSGSRDGTSHKEEDSEEWIEATNVQIDRFNSDLHIRVLNEGYKCNPITVEGFAFMWAGVRANFGVTRGKVLFECKILEHLNVEHLPEEEKTRHVVRVGYSTDTCSMQLGEEKHSYGYGGTAKASTECKFRDFGETFGEGDVIAAYLDMDSNPITIAYAKNGAGLGVCFEVSREELGDETALFPHVLTKNCEFEVNFGQMEKPYFPVKEGFAFINDVPVAERVRGTKPPTGKDQCEMVMICGLPGAGKTYWANKYCQEHADKRYNLLGTNNIIDKMKVMGLPRKGNYTGRWDVLIEKSTRCLTRLLEIAAKRKRNYILDQTNVYPTAQRRKMRPFEGFQRRAVVIVPSDEVFKERVEKREKEEGKEIPDNAVWEMKANFQLPEEGGCFDKVEFVELARDEAQKLVEQYNKEGREKLKHEPGHGRGGRGGGYGRDDNRDRNRSYDSGGGHNNRDRDNRRDYNRPNNRGSRGGGGGSYMGYSNNDRQRASRYSSGGSGRGGGRDRDRYNNRDNNRSGGGGGGRHYGGNSYSSGGGGYHNNYSSSGDSSTAGGSTAAAAAGSWGQQQGGSSWGGAQQQGTGGWGQQGWGQQGWGGTGYAAANQAWGGYSQQPAQQQAGASAGWGNQGYYGNWSGYYGNQQQQQQGGWGGSGSYSSGGTQ